MTLGGCYILQGGCLCVDQQSCSGARERLGMHLHDKCWHSSRPIFSAEGTWQKVGWHHCLNTERNASQLSYFIEWLMRLRQNMPGVSHYSLVAADGYRTWATFGLAHPVDRVVLVDTYTLVHKPLAYYFMSLMVSVILVTGLKCIAWLILKTIASPLTVILHCYNTTTSIVKTRCSTNYYTDYTHYRSILFTTENSGLCIIKFALQTWTFITYNFCNALQNSFFIRVTESRYKTGWGEGKTSVNWCHWQHNSAANMRTRRKSHILNSQFTRLCTPRQMWNPLCGILYSAVVNL